MPDPRVLFVGLDSADPALLDAWAGSGDLPAMAEFARRSERFDVAVPAGFSNGCAWPSLYTGVNPGRHGRYSSATWLAGTYDYGVPFDETRHLRATPFWVALSDQGTRIGIVDMVRAPLTPALHGFQLADWLTHDRRNAIARSTPASLAPEVIRRYGGDTLGHSPESFLREHDLAAFCDTLLARIDAKARHTLDEARRGGHDLYMTVFGEPHDAGHMLWQFHDRGHPDYDAETAAALRDPMRRVYAAQDAALGRILAEVAADYTVVFAGPGMGPNYTANGVLRDVLAAIATDMSAVPKTPPRPAAPTMRSLARALVPERARLALRNSLPKGVGRAWDVGDMAGHRFFPVPHTGFAGAIRINLRGREPAGCVQPGAEYDRLCEELDERLRQLRNAETGAPLVDQVVHVHRSCAGPAIHQLPDLIAVWNRSAPIRRVLLPGHGEFVAAQPGRRGDHNTSAVMFVAGPGFAAGPAPRTARIEDIAPTVSTWLGREPAGFDGLPISPA